MFIVFVMIIKSFGSIIKHKRMDHCGVASLKHGTEVQGRIQGGSWGSKDPPFRNHIRKAKMRL